MANLLRVLMVSELGSPINQFRFYFSHHYFFISYNSSFHQVAEKPSIALSIASVLSHGQVYIPLYLYRFSSF